MGHRATFVGRMTLVTLADIRAAADLLRGVAVRTPLLPAAELGADVWLKPEMLQRSGAFKLRGAYTFLARLSPEERARGVIAPSSGNHAQAVALAARIFGVPATVVMPVTVTAAKRAGCERLGARIELAGTTTHDRMDRALAIAEAEGQTLVPPYDHPTIIAGQGTCGLEIGEDLPAVRTVLVPVGGGGLSAGVATAIKSMCPEARVVGVEPAGAPKLTRALAAGAPVTLERTQSLADGLMAVRVGTHNFAHHRAYIDEVVTVDDGALRGAMRFLLDRMKLVAEPSGAITVAALLEGLVRPPGPTVAVLSGGNVEWSDLPRLLGG
ncbi:Threonine dehydratase, catabolic [Minicystis rosea]|nr:Threonine dehydratase, catabolic [Minicystis rosea]